MATTGTLSSVESTLTSLEGHLQMGQYDGVPDEVQSLRSQIQAVATSMADGLEGEYQRLVNDDQVPTERIQSLRELCDRLQSEAQGLVAERKVNPVTQPAGPNPSAEADRRAADENEEPVAGQGSPTSASASGGGQLEGEELQNRARALSIEGRSSMSADDLRAEVARREGRA